MGGRGWGSVALVALLALALRAAIFFAVGFNPAFFDADGYHAQALEGLAGRPVPTDGHPPGYPWFLMAIYRIAGPRPRIVYAIQVLLSAAAVFLAGDAARRRFGPRAGVLTAALLATSGILAFYPSLLVSENLCLLGVAGIAWLLLPDHPEVSPARLLCCAVIVAGLALTRTGLLLLALPLVAIPFFDAIRRRQARGLALAALTLAVATAPALAYSWHRAGRTGTFRLGSPADTQSLYFGNNPNATGRTEWFPEAQPGTPEAPDYESLARILGPKARTYFLTHPLREADLFLRRASFNFAPNKRDIIYLYGHGWAGERSPGTLNALYVWIAVGVPVLGAAVLLALARSPREGALRLALLLVFLGVLPYQVSVGDARYLIPFHPLLAFAAGALAASPPSPGQWPARMRLAAAVLAIAFLGNAAYDVWKTDGALRKVTQPGGSRLRPPYIFAR
ncbi:MAG TPA: glycosyltransferase family 39 protein [Thermoanaerobaculia bacterium]|nr:glycosyltransferase family 39 protein [Thermoanaerobaculia bacterium]